jgi:hypothetical protein
MKDLSVKDFISFLSPCFGCGSKNKILFTSESKEITGDIRNNLLTCETSYFYRKKSYFTINLNTSEMETNDINFFNYPVWINICCVKCGGYSRSSLIKIKKIKDKKYIACLNIRLQSFTMPYQNKIYLLFSDAKKEITRVTCNDNKEKDTDFIDFPFTTTIKFKSKEKLIDKINKLFIFK